MEDAQVQVNTGLRIKALSDELVEAFRTLQLKINERGSDGAP